MNAADSLDLAAASVGRRTRRFVAAHPRSIASAVVLALVGFAATAFGIAPMVPDASDLPKRLVTNALRVARTIADLESSEKIEERFLPAYYFLGECYIRDFTRQRPD